MRHDAVFVEGLWVRRSATQRDAAAASRASDGSPPRIVARRHGWMGATPRRRDAKSPRSAEHMRLRERKNLAPLIVPAT